MAELKDISGLIGAVGGVGSSLLGIGLSNTKRKQQMADQKELMDIQKANQMALNKQGQELQLDTWNKTNAEAQVKHYNDAGLSTGLMYGGSGAGGTTGSQGGGSATGGSAPGGQMMEIGTIDAMQKLAQIKLAKAQAEKTEAEANAISGVNKDKTKAETEAILQGINNQKAQEVLTKAQTRAQDLGNELQGRTMDTQIYILEKQSKYIEEDINRLRIDNNINRQQASDKVAMLKAELMGQYIKNQAEAKGIEIQDATLRQMSATLGKTIQETQLMWKQLSVNERNAKSQEIANKIKQEYPSAMQWVGKGANTISEGLEALLKGNLKW